MSLNALPDSAAGGRHRAGGPLGPAARPPRPGRGPVPPPPPVRRHAWSVPLLRTVAARLAGAGCPVLRFNFRGVGASGGSWSGGEAEVGRRGRGRRGRRRRLPRPPPGPGRMVLRGGGRAPLAGPRRRRRRPSPASPRPVRSGLAPPSPPPEALPPARRLFLIGDRDQFTAVERPERLRRRRRSRPAGAARAATTSSSAARRRVAEADRRPPHRGRRLTRAAAVSGRESRGCAPRRGCRARTRPPGCGRPGRRPRPGGSPRLELRLVVAVVDPHLVAQADEAGSGNRRKRPMLSILRLRRRH